MPIFEYINGQRLQLLEGMTKIPAEKNDGEFDVIEYRGCAIGTFGEALGFALFAHSTHIGEAADLAAAAKIIDALPRFRCKFTDGTEGEVSAPEEFEALFCAEQKYRKAVVGGGARDFEIEQIES